MQALVDRLKEPSTWAGLGVVLGLFGIHLAPEKLTAVVGVATAVAALVAIFLPERGAGV